MSELKDTSRYRNGERDDDARAAHSAESASWRYDIAEVVFSVEDQQELLARLRAGWALPAAAASVGMRYQAIYGRAKWDSSFHEQLEAVLAETCPAGRWCGRPSGVKHGGHCASCRAAHHPPSGR